VVNTASIAGIAGIGSSLPYACSKGAMITMTLSLARALGPNIRVNAIAPGFMDTGWFSNNLPPEDVERRRQSAVKVTPLKVASKAEDIAGAAVFLASSSARHITGETLVVDAGMHLNFA
jgi:NAD(P)-dependent dehydrogenase (short-subunit alcohol dehydrogenase family)